jgi:hypothetical protein
MLHIEYHDMDADSTTDNSDMSDQASKSSPAPSKSDQTASAPKPVGQSEVFHIGGNDYTYEDAPAVCAAYDSELATYDQLSGVLMDGRRAVWLCTLPSNLRGHSYKLIRIKAPHVDALESTEDTLTPPPSLE